MKKRHIRAAFVDLQNALNIRLPDFTTLDEVFQCLQCPSMRPARKFSLTGVLSHLASRYSPLLCIDYIYLSTFSHRTLNAKLGIEWDILPDKIMNLRVVFRCRLCPSDNTFSKDDVERHFRKEYVCLHVPVFDSSP